MKKYSKRSSSKKYSFLERKSFKRGFLLGLKKRKPISKKSRKKTFNKSSGKAESLLDTIKRYRERNLGVLYHNGKYYDTNFIDKPVEIKKSEFKRLHEEYDGMNGRRSDIDVANSYVRHMRNKYGVFEKGTGKFLGMLGEEGTL